MRIISRALLRTFWESHAGREAEKSLRVWLEEAKRESWAGPHDVKAQYPKASILKNGRVVFNISGNKFRLVVSIRYDIGVIFTRFVGTHAQYDRIDAQEV